MNSDKPPIAQTPIDDPQNQSTYQLADPNINAVENSVVATPNDNQRNLLRQTISGSQRGNWDIMGSIFVSEGSIQVTNADGTIVGLGTIPGSDQFGFFSLDKNGKLIMKIVAGTKYVYDPANNYVNITQDGLLPDGTGGFISMKPGINVSSAFS